MSSRLGDGQGMTRGCSLVEPRLPRSRDVTLIKVNTYIIKVNTYIIKVNDYVLQYVSQSPSLSRQQVRDPTNPHRNHLGDPAARTSNIWLLDTGPHRV